MSNIINKNKNQSTDDPTPPNNMPSTMSDCLNNLTNTLQAASKKWEIIIFPSLVAFIVASSLGFYLIFNMVESANKMADAVVSMNNKMDKIEESMIIISKDLTSTQKSIEKMSNQFDSVSLSIVEMNQTINLLNQNIEKINYNMSLITPSVQGIRRSISPSGMMRNMMPW